MWKIQLPIEIPCNDQSKPVKHRPGWEQPYFSLNLNQYRNAHHQILNNAKVNFNKLAKRLIRASGVPRLERCVLEYVLYPGTRQLCDVNNVCSIADKFFSDALVSAGILADDNYNFIADTRFRFGAIDRENPRVDVFIRNPDLTTTGSSEPITESREDMKIVTRSTHIVTLTKEDMVEALKEFLSKQITISNETVLGQLTALSDGSYELRVEVGGDSLTEAPKRRSRPPKLEPKEAIQQLNEAAAAKKAEESKPAEDAPAQESDDEGEETAEPPEPAKELPTVVTGPGAPTREAQTHTEPPEEKGHAEPAKVETEEKPPEKKKAPTLFGNFTRPKNP
jgi:hypothetical protein